MPAETPYTTVIFDLDGTLADPGPAIATAIQAALAHFDIIEHDERRLRSFVGPALTETFAGYGLDAGQILVARELYRRHFREHGIAHYTLYPGIIELLQALGEAGMLLAVATTKGKEDAERILSSLVGSAFARICGGVAVRPGSEKHAQIQEVLDCHPPASPRAAIMVGDTVYDIRAARHCGIDALAVGYGYGLPEALLAAAPDHFAPSVAGLWPILLPGHAPWGLP